MALPPPVALRLTSDALEHRGPTFLDVEWDPVDGAADYELDVVDAAGSVTIQSKCVAVRVAGLIANRGYRLIARARAAGEVSADSAAIDVCTSLPTPHYVRTNSLAGLVAGALMLSWDESALVLDTTYEVTLDVLREAEDGTRSLLLSGLPLVGSRTLVGVGGTIRLLQRLTSRHLYAPGSLNRSPESSVADTSIVAATVAVGLGSAVFRHRELLRRALPTLPEN